MGNLTLVVALARDKAVATDDKHNAPALRKHYFEGLWAVLSAARSAAFALEPASDDAEGDPRLTEAVQRSRGAIGNTQVLQQFLQTAKRAPNQS